MAELEGHKRGDHISFNAFCPQCRGAATSRLRQHFRRDVSGWPGGQLSIDTSGPHPPGRWPSGRPENVPRHAVHFLLGAFSVKTKAEMAAMRGRECETRGDARVAVGGGRGGDRDPGGVTVGAAGVDPASPQHLGADLALETAIVDESPEAGRAATPQARQLASLVARAFEVDDLAPAGGASWVGLCCEAH
ncbi:unnamed protein product [Prorocentrum cordatum]|uniref:Uncharacterized protein n=1 Tax=Prorocentrum cordatum TaxID=2364126 RepID=A0ABN9T345_9DINO|nr:unnamed protein product [Polarella glacialis]